MAEATPPPPLSLRTRLALAIGGVIGGLVITVAVLRALDPPALDALRTPPAAPSSEIIAPPAPALTPPTEAQVKTAWQRLRTLADELATDGGPAAVYASSEVLRDEYEAPAAWATAVTDLRNRLADLPAGPPAPGGPVDFRSRPGEQGAQDIVTLTGHDGRRVMVFFEGANLVGFDAR